MALNATQLGNVLRDYRDWWETSAAEPYRNVDLHSSRAAITTAINAMTAALEAAVPGIRQSANGGISNQVKNRLLKSIAAQLIN